MRRGGDDRGFEGRHSDEVRNATTAVPGAQPDVRQRRGADGASGRGGIAGSRPSGGARRSEHGRHAPDGRDRRDGRRPDRGARRPDPRADPPRLGATLAHATVTPTPASVSSLIASAPAPSSVTSSSTTPRGAIHGNAPRPSLGRSG